LLRELRSLGFEVGPGALGDNITTRGINLIALPESSLLHIGEAVVLRLTGLRAPCRQMDKFASGLVAAVIAPPDKSGKRKSRAGVMAVVIVGGEIKSGDRVRVEVPADESRPLKNV
jgi:MOSC domain-containing protein YiiM